MLSNRWARDFKVTDDDLESIMNTLLEGETPLTTRELGVLLIERRLESERTKLEEKYRDTKIYSPAQSYEVGTRVVFTEMELATGTVTEVRPGENPDYGDFEVIAVDFDDDEYNSDDRVREFAAKLSTEHRLSSVDEDSALLSSEMETAEDVIIATEGEVLFIVRDALRDYEPLERVAGYWFPRDLVMGVDIGMLHLSEAVLDMAGGGPLTTAEVIEQIGGLGDAPIGLQVFSLNLALNEDDRFAEVGPAGEVLWYLKRMMPDAVQNVPEILQYTPIDYNEELLSDEMFDLETELDDEFTPIDFEGKLRKAPSTLIYPHRRAGTLPLNAKNRAIFPRARTPIIYVEMIDTEDDERYDCWVVHEHKYVYGLEQYYEKHSLPVGAFITVGRGKTPGQYTLSYDAYKARSEWIRILQPTNNQISFENMKRAIGADYDEFIIIGVDDVAAVDKLAKTYSSKTLTTLLRELIVELGKLSPQGTVHAVTLYSAVNVLRRCAPGPIFATLTSNNDFADLGDHYWALRAKE